MQRDKLDIVLHELSNELREVLGKELDKVILYGSYARGDNRSDSDVDVIALVKLDEEQLQFVRRKLNVICSRIGLKYDLLLSLVVKNEKKFYKDMDILPFYQNIVKEGVVVYAASEKKLIALERLNKAIDDIQKYYPADFDPEDGFRAEYDFSNAKKNPYI